MSKDQNLLLLEKALEIIGDLRDEMVFVGGVIVWTHTDYHREIRTTEDIDVIIEADSYIEYQAFANRLRDDGWVERTRDGDPPCRYTKDSIILDLMSSGDSKLLPPSPWFAVGMEKSIPLRVGNYSVRRFNFEHLLATKFDAFNDRGKGNLAESKDLQDIINLMASSDFEDQLLSWSGPIKNFLHASLNDLQAISDFHRYLEGHFAPDHQHYVEKIEVILNRHLGF